MGNSFPSFQQLERRWRATRLTIDRQIYVEQCKHVNKCIYEAKREYYSGVIFENQSDPKRLFSTVNKLLHRRDDVCLPTSDKLSLVSAFADHFTDKILSIKLGLCSLKSDRGIECTVSDLSCGSSLTEFNPVSPDKLSQLLGGSGLKVCSLDPLPSPLMKNCVDVLLPIVTNIVNCSLDSYTVPHVMKEALVRPILKKASLDHEQLKNYRPISNLPLIAKCCEKVVADQLNQYLAVNELNEVFQSAYKRYHSTERELIRVQNDILRSIDDGGHRRTGTIRPGGAVSFLPEKITQCPNV